MNFVPYDKSSISFYKRTDNQKILEAFRDSGLDCAKVIDSGHANANSCACALRQTIKRLHMGIVVAVRKNEVYLIRKKI